MVTTLDGKTPSEKIASRVEIGWTHPGLLLAGEVIAAALGDDPRKAKLRVATKIMFAVEHPQFPMGIVADIFIEQISGGCGMLLPDAFTGGYLQMNPSFSTGLQAALWAARDHAAKHLGTAVQSCDWRWSIDLLTATRLLPIKPVQLRLVGPSAQTAFACGIIAAHPANPDNKDGIDPLDPHVGATAALAAPGKNDRLNGVGAIDVKTLVAAMDVKRLWDIVIADNQADNCLPNDERIVPHQAESVADAYDLMTRYPRLTRAVNKSLLAEATKLKDDRCDPYVLPAFVERLEGDPQDANADELDADELESLKRDPVKRGRELDVSEQKLQLLMTGQLGSNEKQPTSADEWIGNRVRIFGDSGLGKSVFVLHSEQQIAASGLNLVPVRLGRVTGEDSSLANVTWSIGTDQVIDKLADLPSITHAIHQLEAQYEKLEINTERRRDWFRWMIRHGRIVFLPRRSRSGGGRCTGNGRLLRQRGRATLSRNYDRTTGSTSKSGGSVYRQSTLAHLANAAVRQRTPGGISRRKVGRRIAIRD